MIKRVLTSDAIFGSIILAISMGFYVLSYRFSRETVGGNVNEGFFPRVLAIIVGLMALYIIIDSIRKNVRWFVLTEEQKQSIKPMLYMMGMFIVYILAWNHVHFIIKTLILLLIMCNILKMNLVFSLVYSTGFTLGIFLLFTKGFNILL